MLQGTELKYYASKDRKEKEARRKTSNNNTINLDKCCKLSTSDSRTGFQLDICGKAYRFSAADEVECEEWLRGEGVVWVWHRVLCITIGYYPQNCVHLLLSLPYPCTVITAAMQGVRPCSNSPDEEAQKRSLSGWARMVSSCSGHVLRRMCRIRGVCTTCAVYWAMIGNIQVNSPITIQ